MGYVGLLWVQGLVYIPSWQCCMQFHDTLYCQTSSISHSLVGNKLVDHSVVVGASPIRRCSNYIFILDLTPGFNELGKDNYNRRRETFKCWDLVRLILEVRQHIGFLYPTVFPYSFAAKARYIIELLFFFIFFSLSFFCIYKTDLTV